MADTRKPSQVNTPENEDGLKMSFLWRDLLRGFGKLWWLTAVLTAVAAVAALPPLHRLQRPLLRLPLHPLRLLRKPARPPMCLRPSTPT